MLIGLDSMESVRKLLKQNFDVIQDDNLMHFKNCTIWRVVIKDTFTPDKGIIIIDIVFADRDIYKNAVTDTISLQINNTVIPVVKPKHLIEIKKLSGRAIDLLDIQALEEAEQEMGKPVLKIYNASQGILPDNYKFDREEAHER
ncbi:Uncharacterized protein dnl_56710 [Desulfonema limicola]|uniref:Uncharacterized protein n=2 Tax=Desulfonema limicola TaxID=45656 RepID=A0A975BDM1_9BACT|nr:Uncharacterized protein dnl_56710 [Desulfonema limicola]